MLTHAYPFPPDFIWGCATAAPQIEGASTADGKGESIWDRFASRTGAIADGSNLATACDHYHRYEADFALMREFGLRYYRLSLAWPRLFPDGRTGPNQAGIDHYRRLFEALHRHGLQPWVTLYHWDLPQALEDSGGWRSRDTVDAFARYATVAVQAFADQVKHWITLNEIPAFVGNGYEEGHHAPGARESTAVLRRIYHHTLLAHGHAVSAMREYGGPNAQVGLAHDLRVPIPVTETPADIAAARAWLERNQAHLLTPLFHGAYPDWYLEQGDAGDRWLNPGDLSLISQPIDFLGLNIYTGHFVQAAADGTSEVIPFPTHYPKADLSWLQIAPQAIYWALRHCHELYNPRAFYITENGAGYDEPDTVTGPLNDLHRRDYLRNYLLNVQRAVAEGLPCRGYFVWSFLDNFEWAEGFRKRFGIVHVDFKTLQRTPKLSARWYSAVIRHQRVV